MNILSQLQRRPSRTDITRPIFHAGMRSATASTMPSNALPWEPRPNLSQRHYFLSFTRRGNPTVQRTQTIMTLCILAAKHGIQLTTSSQMPPFGKLHRLSTCEQWGIQEQGPWVH